MMTYKLHDSYPHSQPYAKKFLICLNRLCNRFSLWPKPFAIRKALSEQKYCFKWGKLIIIASLKARPHLRGAVRCGTARRKEILERCGAARWQKKTARGKMLTVHIFTASHRPHLTAPHHSSVTALEEYSWLHFFMKTVPFRAAPHHASVGACIISFAASHLSSPRRTAQV